MTSTPLPASRLLPGLLLTLALALPGCPTTTADDDDDDSAIDEPCVPLADENRQLVPEGPISQVHPSVGADSAGRVLLAFNALAQDERYGTWLAALPCAVPSEEEPLLLSPAGDPANHFDPSVAVGPDGAALIAWHHDHPTAPFNLGAWTARIEPDGSPAAARPLVLTRDGGPWDGGVWMPEVAPYDDGFALVATRGLQDLDRFQVFLQTLDADGAPLDDTLDLHLAGDETQSEPDLSTTELGQILVGYRVQPDSDAEPEFTAQVLVEGGVPGAPVVAFPDAVGVPGATRDQSPNGGYLAAARGSSEIVLKEARLLLPAPPTLTLGSGGLLHDPAIAAGPRVEGLRQGLVAWLEVESGFRNTLWIRGFVDDGGGVTLGEASAIATQVAAYQPGVVALPEGGFLVVWSEGDSPEFEVWGRYLVSAVEPAEF